MFEEELKRYEAYLKSFKFPKITEMPIVDLYMDQVIEYTKSFFKIIDLGDQKELITPSMINNYVKSGIIPAPKGKKYSRRHIAYIIVVFYFKQILTLDEVKALIDHQIKQNDERGAYRYFCESLESEFSNCCNHHYNEIINDASATYENFSLKYSARGIANKIYAQHIIYLQKKYNA